MHSHIFSSSLLRGMQSRVLTPLSHCQSLIKNHQVTVSSLVCSMSLVAAYSQKCTILFPSLPP